MCQTCLVTGLGRSSTIMGQGTSNVYCSHAWIEKHPTPKVNTKWKQDKRTLKPCAEGKCSTLVTRLDKHMRQFHSKTNKTEQLQPINSPRTAERQENK